MAISEFSKKYHEKMFPGYRSSFLETDPEFIERFDNFAFDEVVNSDDLDDKVRFIAILATLIGCQGTDEYRAMLPAALNYGVSLSGGGLSRHRQGVPLPENRQRSALIARGKTSPRGTGEYRGGKPPGSGRTGAHRYFW